MAHDELEKQQCPPVRIISKLPVALCHPFKARGAVSGFWKDREPNPLSTAAIPNFWGFPSLTNVMVNRLPEEFQAEGFYG